MARSTTPSAAQLVSAEEAAANALLNLLTTARASKDALTVRAAAQALSCLSSYYTRTSSDEEQNRLPDVDVSALAQAIGDHYALATFIAQNPALAERQGIRISQWGDSFDSEVDKVRYWRSPEQQLIDKERQAQYLREREAEKAAESAS